MKRRLLLLLALASPFVRAETATDAAIGLFRAGQYAQARAALGVLVAAEPTNAPACYYLGMALRRRGDPRALDDALPWLEKASTLAPGNADYLADFGGTCLQVANRRRSYALATRGRDTLEKALHLDPANLDTRYGLMRFYAEAPWPLGDTAEALAQADAIGQRNPARGVKAWITLGKYFAAHRRTGRARDAWRRALRLEPHSVEAQTLLAGLK